MGIERPAGFPEDSPAPVDDRNTIRARMVEGATRDKNDQRAIVVMPPTGPTRLDDSLTTDNLTPTEREPKQHPTRRPTRRCRIHLQLPPPHHPIEPLRVREVRGPAGIGSLEPFQQFGVPFDSAGRHLLEHLLIRMLGAAGACAFSVDAVVIVIGRQGHRHNLHAASPAPWAEAVAQRKPPRFRERRRSSTT